MIKYKCPNCGGRVSASVLIVKWVSCTNCGSRIKVADAIGMSFAIPAFLAAGISYQTGNYYIAAITLVVSAVIISVIAKNHLKEANGP